MQRGGGNLLKQVAALPLGARQSVVVIEVDKTWLVVGVSPNQLTTLHTMPAGELPEGASLPASAFAAKLGQALRRQPATLMNFLRRMTSRAGRGMLPMLGAAALLGLALFPAGVVAQATLPALTATPGPNGSETYSLSMQTMLLMTSLSFLPAALLMMTGFTRIIIVLACCAAPWARRCRRPTTC